MTTEQNTYPKWLPLTLVALFTAALLATGLSYTHPTSNSEAADFLNRKEGLAILHLDGPIMFTDQGSSLFSGGEIERLIHEIDTLRENKNVKGVVLRINSPGGTVGASQELYDALLRLKSTRSIPITASIADVGASGAYYTAIASDTIFANPGSLVGSIGVILGNINFTELAQQYGIDYNVYKSGPYKDILSSWRQPTAQEEKMLNTLIQNVHQQFVGAVQTQRNLPEDRLKAITQGQFFTGQQALELGLIDQLGSFHDAIVYTAKKAGLPEKPHLIQSAEDPFEGLIEFMTHRLGNLMKWRVLSPFPQLQ